MGSRTKVFTATAEPPVDVDEPADSIPFDPLFRTSAASSVRGCGTPSINFIRIALPAFKHAVVEVGFRVVGVHPFWQRDCAIEGAVAALPTDLHPSEDLHASAAIKAHLAGVLLRRVAKQLASPPIAGIAP